jgi:hypothetical protein
MKMLKNFLSYLLMISAVLAFSSCSDDDDDDATQTADGKIETQDDIDLVVDKLQGEITGDITLAANKNWILTGPLVVSAGGKLTIEAGATIKATAGGTNVYIAVEKDAEIQAVGTASAPIKITSNASSPEAGDWGGLLLMGNATITGGQSAVTEVVDFIYGGNDDADDSGNIDYLILEYTGARINGEKEFNGLTLYGVGSGTSISNVAVFYGDDDAFEWFGGTVNITNALAINAKDDMFDWTQGWKGTATNLYGKRELGFDAVTADPRGLEGDGNLDGLTPSLSPQSNPTITNLTIVNNSTVTDGMVDVVKIRRGSSATVTNANVIFSANTPAPGDFVDLTDSAGDAAGTTSVNISGTGANLNTSDNKPGANNGTITIPANANTGVANPATLFSWTGYTSF